MDPVSDFTYEPLPDAMHYIRLLEIQPTVYPEDENVRCVLSMHPLNDAPAYFAVSYTWGPAAELTTIQINGRDMTVRHTCKYVLQQARAHGIGRHFWVDAVCINQQDLNERSAQVQQMGRIFTTALHVNACIGKEADDSTFVMAKLDTFPRVQLDPLKHLGSRALAFTHAVFWLLSQNKTNIVRLLEGLRAMLTRVYFQRVWVIQEVFAKQDRTTICCGKDRLSLQVLVTLAHTLRAVTMNPDGGFSRLSLSFAFETVKSFLNTFSMRRLAAIDPMYRFYDYPSASSSFLLDVSFAGQRVSNRPSGLTCQDGRDGLKEIVGMLKHFECHDPRDRVYGTISLIDWEGSRPIITDYHKSTFEVILEVLLHGWNRGRYNTMAQVMELVLGFRAGSTGTQFAREILEYRASSAKSATLMRLEGSPQRVLFDAWCEVSSDDGTKLHGGIDAAVANDVEPLPKGHGTSNIATVLLADHHNGFHADTRIMIGLEQHAQDFMSLKGLSLSHGSCDTNQMVGDSSISRFFEVHLDPEDALVLAIILMYSYPSDITPQFIEVLGGSFCRSFSSSLAKPITTFGNNIPILKMRTALLTWQDVEHNRQSKISQGPKLLWRIRK